MEGRSRANCLNCEEYEERREVVAKIYCCVEGAE